jgi:predicted RNase H-like HicB family nuclease
MAEKHYRAIAFQDPSDSPEASWDVIFPEFPGCVTSGATSEAALRSMREALSGHLAAMVEDGQAVPAVPRLGDPLPDWVREDVPMGRHEVLWVPVDVPGRAVRPNITMDEGLLGRLDTAAQAEGKTRSAWIADAVRERLNARYGGLAEGHPMWGSPRGELSQSALDDIIEIGRGGGTTKQIQRRVLTRIKAYDKVFLAAEVGRARANLGELIATSFNGFSKQPAEHAGEIEALAFAITVLRRRFNPPASARGR